MFAAKQASYWPLIGLVRTRCWHLLCAHSPEPSFSHYANSTIIYLGVLMGLTQVMLQVKDCEMVCKQRELIPRLKRLSPTCTELTLHLPFFASLHSSFSSFLSFSLYSPSSQPGPACQIVSDSILQKLSGPSKRYPNTAWKAVCLQKWDWIRINTVYPCCPTPEPIHPPEASQTSLRISCTSSTDSMASQLAVI